METLCKDCIFAGPQFCDWNIPTKFMEQGTVIDLDKDNFYIIQDRICVFGRSESWKKNQNENIKSVVLKEIEIKYSLIVVADECSRIDDIIWTVNGLQNQNIQPQKLIVVILHNKSIVASTREFLNELNILYRLEYIIDDKSDKIDAINLGAKKTETRWYAAIEAGQLLPNNFSNVINIALNEKLIKFVAVVPMEDNGEPIFIQNNIHEFIGYGDPFKMRENPEWKKMIKTFLELQ
jgi:hypothetical protein